MSHSIIVQKFANRTKNSRTKVPSWQGFHVFSNETTLYSYGRHFPLAIYLGENKEGHVFIKNSDKYSQSTSAHQSLTNRFCNGPSVSRRMLNQAFAESNKFETDFELGGQKHQISIPISDTSDVFLKLKLDNVYLWRKGFRKFLWKDLKTGIYYSNCVYSGKIEDSSQTIHYTDEVVLPRYARFNGYQDHRTRFNGRFQDGCAFANEFLVLEINQIYYLCNSVNIWILPRKPKNITEALKLRHSKNAICK